MTPQPHTQIKNVSRFHASFVNSPNVVWLQENVVKHPRPQFLECTSRKARAGRADRVSEDNRTSQGCHKLPLPPPIEDHLIQLLPQRLHVGIGKGAVHRAHTVRVRTRATDRAVELGLADFAGRALGGPAMNRSGCAW